MWQINASHILNLIFQNYPSEKDTIIMYYVYFTAKKAQRSKVAHTNQGHLFRTVRLRFKLLLINLMGNISELGSFLSFFTL